MLSCSNLPAVDIVDIIVTVVSSSSGGGGGGGVITAYRTHRKIPFIAHLHRRHGAAARARGRRAASKPYNVHMVQPLATPHRIGLGER